MDRDLSHAPTSPPGASAATILGGVASLILAPQVTLLSGPDRPLAAGVSVACAAVCAALLGAVELAAVRAWLTNRSSSDANRTTWRLLAAAHLPLLALWWPALAQVGVSAFRGWVPAAVLSGVALAGILGARGGPLAALERRLAAVALTTSFALLASLGLATARSAEGPYFLLGIVWAAYLVAALVGWGTVVGRLARADSTLDWGLRAAWGLALAVAVGGLLNLVWAISPLSVLLFLAAGFGVWWDSIEWRHLSGRLRAAVPRTLIADPLGVVLTTLLVTLAAIQVAGSLAGTVDTGLERPPFDLHDDSQAYLVFPEKMLQLGSMGPEPFEARRMLSLGGQSFLQVLVRVALPVRALHLMDGGVALILILGLVLGAARRWRIGRGGTTLAVLLVLTLTHLQMRGNTSALLTGVVLLIALYRTMESEVLSGAAGWRGAGLVALCAGGMCALKSSLIPAAVALLGTSYASLAASGQDRRQVAREVALAGVLVACLLVPWMISVHESSDTLLYPVLGKGLYGAVFTDNFSDVKGDFEPRPLETWQAAWRLLEQHLPVLLILLFAQAGNRRAAAASVAAAAAATALALVVFGDPSLSRSLTRYTFPTYAAALVAATLTALRPDKERSRRAPLAAMAAVAVVIGLTLDNEPAIEKMYDRILGNAHSALVGRPLVSEGERLAIAELSSVVPPSATILATVPSPFLLDFSQHRVRIMSLPGMAGLPPGMPVYAGAEAVASYLEDHGIRYLAYGGMADLRDLLKLTEAQIVANYPRSRTRWAMLRYHQSYQLLMRELASTRKRLYSDPTTVLLDLAERAFTVVPQERPDDTEGFVDGAWTSGDAVIRRLGCDPCGELLVVSTMGWNRAATTREQLRLEVYADGRRLPFVRQAAGGFVFRLSEGPSKLDTLRITSAVFAPEVVGERAGGRPVGVDIKAVEVVDDERLADVPIATVIRSFTGPLLPERVTTKSGFYEDFNWTNGDATLADLDWAVEGGVSSLVVVLYPVHPTAADPAALGVRVSVNGLALVPLAAASSELEFALPEGLDRIDTIRLESSTFSPRDRGANDVRTLGIPVQSIRLQ